MKIFLFLLILSTTGIAADFSDFNSCQERMTRSALEKKLRLFLKRDARIEGYFDLKEDVLNVYSKLPGHPERALEYCLKLLPNEEEMSLLSVSVPIRENLKGVRIAIDPGHFGGPFCRLEERYIDIPPNLGRKVSLQFDEGTLSYLTAVHLKSLLENEGAVVLLTRQAIGEGALSIGFFDWMKENPQLWLPDMTLQKLFKRYNQADLYARSEKINAFQPDVSIVIHFNSQAREGLSSNSTVTASNFNMIFIPGAFSADELIDKESRYEFMRLLVSNDPYHSLSLSQALLAQFTKHLQVPVVTAADGARYLDTVCLKVEEGIYARNLALTRLIHGPVSYGETLIQNNIDESENLNRRDCEIDGVLCSSRIKEVAEAYFEGIQNYLKIPPCSKMACPGQDL